jgi:hypothetical protein
MAVKQVGVPNSAPLTGNESMAATNTITDEAGSMALPGSPSESTTGKDTGAPVPGIPADQVPLIPTAGKYDVGGEPHVPVPRSDGGWTTGVQGGGNQGHGNPGAGSSGADLWKPTESSS